MPIRAGWGAKGRGMLLAAVVCAPAHADCAPGRVDFPAARAGFSVEIADDATERAKGLMNRPKMASGAGMLFVYDAPGHPHFWMKNTLIPLDMLFLAPDGTITRIAPDAVPLDETPIDGGEGVQYVLEINGGLAAKLGLKPGDAMRWPGLGATAAAPCN